MKILSLLFVFLIYSNFMACKGDNTLNSKKELQKQALIADSGMVVSAHPEASKIGIAILRNGGNAIDAACAVHFALAVCYPSAGNLGGGGYMLIRLQNGQKDAIDYREIAPAKASRNMFLDSKGNPIVKMSLSTHKASGIPGSVDGILKVHEKYGKLNFKLIIQPAIELAINGFKITQKQANEFNAMQNELKLLNTKSNSFLKASKWIVGDVLIQKDLAQTLSLIKEKGRAGFYEGETALKMQTEMKLGNGLIQLSDFKAYTAQWRKPIEGFYRNYKIISMPPSSSGGIALLQLLKMVEPYNLKSMGFHSSHAIHLMAEAEKRVYADRASFLGDPKFFKVPIDGLIDSLYLLDRMKTFNPNLATPSKDIKAGQPSYKESEETTHFSIVDKWRNAVSSTTTLNMSYGSKIIVNGAGFFMNNEMDDFSVKPGVPNFYGLTGNEANAIEPGKRMLSCMTPSIVEKDNKVYLVLGTPGGSTIITSVFQTIVNVIDFEMNMQKAVDASRFHHQWLPDQIDFELNGLSEKDIYALKKLGHKFHSRKAIGRVDAIRINNKNKLEAGADHRGDDKAESY